MDNSHIQHKVTEYILDLLPDEEKQAAARHLAACEECRLALKREREVGRLLQTTLNTVTRPKAGRLQALMPAVPTRRAPILALLAPYRQWAMACLLLAAMMGAFLFGGEGSYDRLTRPTNGQLVTFSAMDPAGTAESITTNEAGTLDSPAVQPTVALQHSPVFVNGPGQDSPPAVPLPVAPQVTPAPAATYFQ